MRSLYSALGSRLRKLVIVEGDALWVNQGMYKIERLQASDESQHRTTVYNRCMDPRGSREGHDHERFRGAPDILFRFRLRDGFVGRHACLGEPLPSHLADAGSQAPPLARFRRHRG